MTAVPDIVEFLVQCPPFDTFDTFDTFDAGAVERLAGAVEAGFHPAGATIFPKGAEALELLRVIRAGVAEGVDDHSLGLPVHRPHHSLGDALATAQVFIALATLSDAYRPQTVGTLDLARRRAQTFADCPAGVWPAAGRRGAGGPGGPVLACPRHTTAKGTVPARCRDRPGPALLDPT